MIRNLTRDELDIVVGWAAQEGWNPGLHDADIFWNTDPNGFIALEKDGELIGSGSVVSYHGNYGFMGFFIVRSDFRGLGLGTKLWFFRRDKLLSRLKPGTAIGMDGVFNMQPFYAKGGFKFSHRDLRMESRSESREYSRNITKIKPLDFKDVNRFDKKYFGFDRKVFLKGWLNMDKSQSLKYCESGKITGYGVIRKCQTGYKIGPLFAENYEIADELYKGLTNFAVGEQVFLDIPEINKDGMKLAKKYGMKECFGCARMYFGKPPSLPYDQIFSVTTFELG